VRGAAVALALFFAAAAPAGDDGHPVTAWRLDGAENRVYLLGSVHLLRKEDHPLPEVIGDLYEDAETLVMEMDVDDVDVGQAQDLIRELGMIEAGHRLAELMGAEAWSRARALAAKVHIPLAALERSEPWLAAITVEQLVLARIGFDPEYGIENHLAGRAVEDGKEVIGMETLREQLGFLDGMSLEAQRELLLQSLEESAEIETLMDELVCAWRYGDLALLERNMLAEIRKYPELYAALVVERNRRWASRIAELTDDADDYLVVVGALHLVGEDGLPALLEQRGHELTQLRNPQISTISKSSLPAPQSGQRQDKGTSSQRVPGGIPDCGSPSPSS
jgi:uncharacterized protein YbaP (TraB family)